MMVELGSDARLDLQDGRKQGLRDRLTLGRAEDNDVCLSGRGVSRHHAVLRWSNGRWCLEDRGSVNGTFVNGTRVPFGTPHPLRHGDRIRLGTEEIVFSWPGDAHDPDRTEQFEAVPAAVAVTLSPFQRQVVAALCGAWLSTGDMAGMPSNREIAAALGTPGAEGSVKAALRRIYAKTGLAGRPAHEKRRSLCRLAHEQGWLDVG
jgi:hypothetical protein